MAEALPPETQGTLAGRLNRLFDIVRPHGGNRQFSNSEVATATNVSGTYIGYLRRGVRDNPSVDTIQALARFFGVRPGYLVDDDLDAEDDEKAALTEAQVRLVQALDDPGIRQLALRAAAADLSPTGLDAIATMIDQVKKLEQSAAASSGRGPKETGSPPAKRGR